jgi:hypothetical protein
MKKHLWWLAAVALALGLVAQYAIYRMERPAIQAHASWVSQPESFTELADESKAIVEAEVIAVNPGKPIVVPAKGEPSGQDSIPTENITIRVVSTQKGDAKAGDTLTVFRTGGAVNIPEGPRRGDNPLDPGRGTQRQEAQGEKPKADPNLPLPARAETKPDPDAPAAVTAQILVLPEDPAYAVGSRVFLALTDGPDGTMRPVAPSGRYEVAGDGTLRSVVQDGLSGQINGMSLAEVQKAASGESSLGGGGDRRVTAPGEGSVGMPTTGHGHDGFDWMLFFGIGMLLTFAGLGTLMLSGIRSTIIRIRNRN